MLENWLHPLSSELINDIDCKDFHFGKKIKIYRKKMPTLKKGQIAIIGLNPQIADEVRRELYKLSYAFKGTVIIDLGNARRTEPDFLLQLLIDLYESKIIPVFIGGSPSLALTQYKAHRMVQSAINLSVIDELIPYNTGEEDAWLNFVLDNTRSKLFHLSLLGVQSHFLPPDIIQQLTERKHDVIRLGKVRNKLQDTEPILRDADTLAINLSAVKAADAPGQLHPSPSGLSSEEICQLLRYAGMSEKLTAAGFYGFLPEKDIEGRTAQTVAQMIWYFIDGFHNRKNDYPVSSDNMTEYITQVQGYDQQFTFWRSTKSGRWWLQAPIKIKKNLQRHKLIPCTYDDYSKAVNGEIPERLLNALERFD